MKWMPLLFAAAALALTCVSCATQAKTMPSAADLDRSYERYRLAAQPQFDDLERRRKSGELSQSQYEQQKADLEYTVQRRATDSAWTAHSLAESERRATGIPTPDQPVTAPVGTGGGGVSGDASFYRSHNDQYGSSSQGFGAGGRMGGGGAGYSYGGSVLGGGRPYY